MALSDELFGRTPSNDYTLALMADPGYDVTSLTVTPVQNAATAADIVTNKIQAHIRCHVERSYSRFRPNFAAFEDIWTHSVFNHAIAFRALVCSVNLDEILGRQMAIATATYANNGICPLTGDRVLKANTVKRTLQLLFSCGMYDYSGEWACTVGLPAKSGVSGIIYIVIPDVLGLASIREP